MGARPIALLDSLRFGGLDNPHNGRLLKGVVSGIAGYGNCMGVPTVGGEIVFSDIYALNPLVNVFCVGIAQRDRIFRGKAAGVGNPVIYFGSRTGRDGIHGATMASGSFDDESAQKRPTVQVGDPFTEKLLLEACLELMATDAIVAIQDMGAAGLTSSSVEMASKGGAGIRLNMNAVPCREEGMTPYEMMLSESQERMLMVLNPGKEPMAETIFRKWELDFAVIGEVTDTGHMVLEFDGEVVADIPLAPLADDPDQNLLSLAQIRPLTAQTLYPDEGPPKWNGITMWRAVTVGEPFLTGRTMIMAGEHFGRCIVVYPISERLEHQGRTLINWVAGVKTAARQSMPPQDWSYASRSDEVLEPFATPHLVAGWMRGSHNGPLMPVAMGDSTPARFDGPPRVIGMGFQLADGRLVGPRDMLADVSFDRARAQALEMADHMRRMGPFEPGRLPLEDMEYTTMPAVAAKLEARWEPLEEPAAPLSA